MWRRGSSNSAVHSHKWEDGVTHSVLRRDPFYESDWQGRFFSLLIAFSSSLLQSAPSYPTSTSVSASERAEQSFALDSSSVFSVDPGLRRLQAFGDHLGGVDHGSI